MLPADPAALMSREDLEREYSPSSCVDNFAELINAYGVRSRASEKQARVLKDLQYGEAACERVDVFPCEGASDRPLLIFIHGGYWQELSKNESTFAGADLAKNNIGYAAIDYEIAPAGAIDAMVSQCVRSIVWLRDNAERFGYSPQKLYLAGSSAGAHLAAMAMIRLQQDAGDCRSFLQGAILLSGVYDLRPIVDTYVNEPLKLDKERAIALSPQFADLAALPPVIISWGEHETDEFKRQSRDFAARCLESSLSVRSYETPGRNHFDIVFDLGSFRVDDEKFQLKSA